MPKKETKTLRACNSKTPLPFYLNSILFSVQFVNYLEKGFEKIRFVVKSFLNDTYWVFIRDLTCEYSIFLLKIEFCIYFDIFFMYRRIPFGVRLKVFLCVRAYKCTYVRKEMNKLTLYTNGDYVPWNVPNIFKVAVVSFIQAFAVSPEIVPVPESHRNVALLISSQSRITFGRSFNCQGAREKTSLKG